MIRAKEESWSNRAGATKPLTPAQERNSGKTRSGSDSKSNPIRKAIGPNTRSSAGSPQFRADKAEKYAREVLALVPFLGNTEMGLVEEKRGNNDKAAEYFQASLDENPDYGEAKAGLERVTKEAGA